jgi:anti-anti-sigma factor
VELDGAVDLAVAPDLRERLLSATPTPQEERLVLDLTRVTLLDAAAMGVIAVAARTYREVELRNPCPVLRKVLDAGGLTQVVRIR